MSNYIEDPNMPPILREALIASNNEYQAELRDYFSGQESDGKFKISTTALSKPSQATVLFSRHRKDIWIDPEKDCWHSMRGSVIHYILETQAAKSSRYLTEQRLGVDIEVDGEIIHVHGKMDIYDKAFESIDDWKNTSATSMMYDKSDHRWQLNILYYIMRKNGYPVKRLRDIYLFDRLDVTKMKMPGYPQHLYQVVEVEKMPLAEIKAYIVERVRIIKAEHNKIDKKLTPCTDEERWIRGTLHKLYLRKKPKNKSDTNPDFSSFAANTFNSDEDIRDHIKEQGYLADQYQIKVVKGEPRGCDFCSVKTVCRQRLNEVIAKDAADAAKQSK